MLPKPPPMTENGPPCILDVGLSLAPTGLYWTLALARTVPVWLPQSHWSIVEDFRFFVRDTRLLARLTGSIEANAGEIVAATIGSWREARDAFGFESTPRLYWHEGGRSGSVVPKDGDAGLIERIDALAAGFDGRRKSVGAGMGESGEPDALADCARDTAALAAALGGYHPVVLSPLTQGEAMPELARQLEAIGVGCTRLTADPFIADWRTPLVSVLIASGLGVALAAGRLRLAALAVVAPRLPIIPSRGFAGLTEPDTLAWNDDGGAAEAALWDDASAVWWELP